MFSKSSNICKKLLELKGRQSTKYYTISQVLYFLVVKRPCLAYSNPLVVYQYKYLRSCLAATSIGGKKGFRLRPIDVASTYINNYYYYYFVVVFFQLSNDLASLVVYQYESLTLKLKQKEFHAYRIPQKHWGIQK